MAAFMDMMFIIQFFFIFMILFLKLYNILNMGKKIQIGYSILLFACYFLFWFIGQQITLFIDYNSISKLIYIQFFNLETLFIMVNILFFIIELMLNFIKLPDNISPYNAIQERKKWN